MEMNIIHNELKANPVLESKFSNIITNQKKQSIWPDITEKVNAVGNAKRTMMRSGTNGEKCVGMPRTNLQGIGERQKGPEGSPPTPLSQSVTDIVDRYKDCSSLMGIPGGMETPIFSETGVIL